jgi:NAD(P)-dependent dehydrogenase (short-subunit alcohol dehydrogenase family)
VAWSTDRDALRDRVAVVAGATRGAGRGIAVALGEAGATVICTGRSSTAGVGTIRSDYDRAETIEETAELVTRLGGVGIAVQVDHLESDQVRHLAERVRDDYGHVDVLVNDIWGAEVLRADRRSGTPRSGATTWTVVCASCGWPLIPT